MHIPFLVARKTPPKTKLRSFTTFGRDASGATAVEFGLVALPFMMMIAAIIDVGTYYLALNALDRGIDETARFVRTGEAQTGGISATGVADVKSVDAFKKTVCLKARADGGNFDCSQITVILNSTTSWANILAADQSCTTGTSPNLVMKTGAIGANSLSSYVGGTSAYVIATVCYPWDTARLLPFLSTGNLQGGKMLLQSSMAFQTEPY